MARARGTGTLLTRTTASGEDRWIGQWWADGKQVRRTLGPKRGRGSRKGMTETEANRELARLMAEHEPTKEISEPSQLTVVQVGQALIEELQQRGRKRATIEGYTTVIEQHMAGFFKDTLIGAVDKAKVKAFIKYMDDGGATKQVKSRKTVLNAYKVLHSVLDHAEAEDLIASNPARKVATPTAPKVALGEGEERWLSVEEVEAVCRKSAGDDWGDLEPALWITAAWTGMRIGEITALRWRDVRWAKGSIWVGRAYVRGQVSTPKSNKGRHVPLVGRVAQELEALSKRTNYAADDDLVFAHPDLGTPLDRTKLSKRWQAAVKRAGLRPHRFHDLRHTFATTMLNNLNNDKRAAEQVRQWLGHADLRTTEETYAMWIHDSAETQAAQAAYDRATNPSSQTQETSLGERVSVAA
jgi:integrase